MTNLEWVNTKYRIADELQKAFIEIVPVKDETGSHLDKILQRLVSSTKDNPDLFVKLIDIMKALRWRLLTDIQPVKYNHRVFSATQAVIEEVMYLQSAVDSQTRVMFDDIKYACEFIQKNDSVIGKALSDSIEEIGMDNCIVMAAGGYSQEGINTWFQNSNIDVEVHTTGGLKGFQHETGQVYVVGPPRFFSSSIISSPISSQITFLVPDWYRDMQLPISPISVYADGSFKVETRIHPIDSNAVATILESADDLNNSEADLLPQPHWTVLSEPVRHPGKDEVVARRVLLSGGYACLLDDGERIRTFDSSQPVGERLVDIPVGSVRCGVYLLLRKDESEQGVLYQEALQSFGPVASQISESQKYWKSILSNILSYQGVSQVEVSLKNLGVRAAGRVEEWTATALDRPQRSQDFQLLLQFLGIEQQPTFEYATNLRSRRLHLGQEMRHALEVNMAHIDSTMLKQLHLQGYLELESKNPRFRSIIVARVLAISPYREIISRQRTRILFKDETEGGKWLE